MSNNNKDDVALGLTILAGTALLGYVGYKALKAIGEYEQALVAEQLAEQRRASIQTAIENYIPPPNCHKHGQDAELCKSCHKCMVCRGGVGDTGNRWCKVCDDDFY
jgi:hypothetical protein